ncbi:hypothetical protein NLJ89_g3023 [Agrocybe chaxingu]|uniref:P-type H(+)-exporting transporter n=1 Tax=Agrocybe chaxingu TaxID=84603 RepID=A0A9W8K5F2_9AGAR|nr:hypothetical protein NLJ89_g3023 [Agrocybe chaxingu]
MDPISTTARNLLVVKYCQIASYTALAYDIFITFPQELERIWKRKISGVSVLYLINRYGNLLEFIVVLVVDKLCTTPTGRGKPSELIMILRTYALYNRSLWILIFLLLLLSCQISIAAWTVSASSSLDLPPPLIGDHACLWIMYLVLDVCIFILTLWRTRIYLRSASRSRVITTFMRDGILFFFVITVIHLVNLITFYGDPTDVIQAAGVSFSQHLSSAMISRLVLNLRSGATTPVVMKGPAVRPGGGSRFAWSTSKMTMTMVMAPGELGEEIQVRAAAPMRIRGPQNAMPASYTYFHALCHTILLRMPSCRFESFTIELAPGRKLNEIELDVLEVDEVLKLLQSDWNGLSQEEVDRRLQVFGPNKLEDEHQNLFIHFIGFLWNPLAWTMETFSGITLLLLLTSVICFFNERRAVTGLKALEDSLEIPKVRVRRDGLWKEIVSSHLVPGDLVSFKVDDIVPADCIVVEATNLSVDQAVVTGEPLPQNKEVGDQCICGSTCRNGEAEAVVLSTGSNTFFGHAASLVGEDDTANGIRKIIAQISSLCLLIIGVFVVAEIFVLYAGFHFTYRRGLSSILVLLIGGIPITIPNILSVTLAAGINTLAQCKAIVTRLATFEELAGVSILCFDKTGTLTTNVPTVDRGGMKTYSRFSGEEVVQLAAYASQTENPGAKDAAVLRALEDEKAREGVEILEFRPFNPVDGRTEVTYREKATGRIKRVTKGMTGIIVELCTRNRTEAFENQLEVDVEEAAMRGMSVVAVAYENVPGDDFKADGEGFEFVGFLPIFDPPSQDAKQVIEEARLLGLKVKMLTDGQLSVAKELGRRIGLGDHMYAAKVLREGHPNIDEMISHADGLAGLYPEHRGEVMMRLQAMGYSCAMVGREGSSAAALSSASVGIAVDGATDEVRAAADVILTKPGLSTAIQIVRQSRITIHRMKSCSVYVCAVTILMVVSFAVLAFTYKFDFPPFMTLVIALLNCGTTMTLPLDRALPSHKPDAWDCAEIFSFAIAYGFYLTASTVALVVVIIETSFFQSMFGVQLSSPRPVDPNDPQLHMIAFLQVAILSQALIFITRSHGCFFMERPSFALLGVFVVAQVASSIIAAYGDWGFTQIHHISGGWIGIIWVWNVVWLIPLDGIKFAMKATVVKRLRERRLRKTHEKVEARATGVPVTGTQSRAASIYESFYSNHTNVLKKAVRKVGFKGKFKADREDLRRFTCIQVHRSSQMLARHSNWQPGAAGDPAASAV